ncbi:MAG: hypothetical protein LBP85_09890 [Prevotellaceae bacterium]|jgi:pseudo-rSAM protein|nr:hypothetical protein [Prevotellaceae bacterium]
MKFPVNKYWLYIEPYAYLKYVERHLIVYNELNKTIIEFQNIDDKILNNIAEQLNSDTECCCIEIDEKQRENENVSNFITQLRTNFSGDCIIKTNNFKPLILKQKKEARQQFDFSKIDDLYQIRYKLKLLPREITLHFGMKSEYDKYYPFIDNACSLSSEIDIYNYMGKIYNNIKEYSNVSTLNIICYNDTNYAEINSFINRNHSSYNVFIHCDILQFLNKNVVFNKKHTYCLYCNTDLGKNIESVKNYDNIIFCFYVKNSEEIEKIQAISEQLSITTKIIPAYDNNINFFEKYIFTDRDDIIEQNLSVDDILVNEILNTNFFGRIYVNKFGFITTGSNKSTYLNISEHSINDFILKEMQFNESIWFLLRKNIEPCKNCAYCNLCPPISEYEILLNRFNLCNIYKK